MATQINYNNEEFTQIYDKLKNIQQDMLTELNDINLGISKIVQSGGELDSSRISANIRRFLEEAKISANDGMNNVNEAAFAHLDNTIKNIEEEDV